MLADTDNTTKMWISFFFCYRWPAVCIHGDKSQQERDWVLQGMYNSKGELHIYK